MRITHELLINVSQDEAQKQCHFAREAVLSRIIIDSYAKHHSGDFSVADAATKTITIGDITSPAKGVYIEVDGDCDVYLNGSGDPIVMRKAPVNPTGSVVSDAAYAKLFLECDITTIDVVANYGAAVVGVFVLWGDLVP